MSAVEAAYINPKNLEPPSMQGGARSYAKSWTWRAKGVTCRRLHLNFFPQINPSTDPLEGGP